MVDSSVWINFFSSSPAKAGAELRRRIAEAEPFALSGIIVTQILEGLVRNISRIEHHLSQWDMLEPAGFSTCREAGSIYRAACAKGLNLTTIDTVIAAIAREHGASVFTLDKDFSHVARVVGLSLHAF